MKYVLIIEGSRGDYSAYFPDVPGCVTVGDTLEEVRENALEALSFHLEDEEDLPVARALETILADPEARDLLDGSETFTTVEYHAGAVVSA